MVYARLNPLTFVPLMRCNTCHALFEHGMKYCMHVELFLFGWSSFNGQVITSATHLQTIQSNNCKDMVHWKYLKR